MDQFAPLTAEERATVFREAAARLGLGAATVVEKDFWVCWALRRISSSAVMPAPLFKGGTSLSKAYKVIELFSEDVDMTSSWTVMPWDSSESRTRSAFLVRTSATGNLTN